MTEKEQKIFDMQCASTKQAMLRKGDYDPDANWPPKNWMAVPDALSIEEMVACRPFTYHEVAIEERLRIKRGSLIAEARGDAPVSSVTDKKKETAIDAFMNIFSPERIKEKFKALMGTKKVSYSDMVAEGMAQALREFHEK